MGNRRNNPQDMRISEELEKIKETFCDNYCKHWADAEAKAKAIHVRDHELVAEMVDVIREELSHYCDECPLSRL